MTIVIRTDDVPAALRRAAWRTTVCETLGPFDLRIDPDVPLQGEIRSHVLGPVTVGRVQTSTPHSVHRTPGMVRHDSLDFYRVLLVESGRPRLVQDGRVAQLRPGQMAIYDFTRPYDLVYESAIRFTVFNVPREMLALPVGLVHRLTAVSILPDGVGALAAPLLSRVAVDVETYQSGSADRLSAVVTEVLTATIAERIDQADLVSPETQQRVLLIRIHAFLEQHLGDRRLGPEAVAAAHHISVRYLHRLFATQNMTVAGWIRRRRLEQCRRDLADPALHAVPIGAVAARSGFLDSAHFSRLFRRTYGMPPREYRNRCLAPRS